MRFDPNLARRLSKLERCLYQVFLYLIISASGTNFNAACSLDELFRLISAFEANSVQDASEI